MRSCFARMWGTAEQGTGLDPVTVKTFLAFGMLLNAGAAMDVEQVDAGWAEGVRTDARTMISGSSASTIAPSRTTTLHGDPHADADVHHPSSPRRGTTSRFRAFSFPDTPAGMYRRSETWQPWS